MAKPSPGSRCPALVQSPHHCVTAIGNAQISAQYGLNPDNYWGTGPLLIKTKNSNDEDTIAYYHHDHLQTPVQATDTSGNIVWAASYDAFGRATITTPQVTADKPTISSNLRLPGQYDDGETGLHYNWNRYYDPDTGRYITADPIGLNGGLNTYGYVGGNPLRFTDPTGLLVVAMRVEFAETFIVISNPGDGSQGLSYEGLFRIPDAPCYFLCFFTDAEWEAMVTEMNRNNPLIPPLALLQVDNQVDDPKQCE